MGVSGIPPEFLRCVSDDGRRVVLAEMKIKSVPEWLRDLTSITELDLSRNQLARLPDWLHNMTTINKLDLSYNQLNRLPDWIGQLAALTHLHLQFNYLYEIPRSLGNLTTLSTLDLSDNQLVRLPDSLGNLSSLRELILNNNRLTGLPEQLGDLLVSRLYLQVNNNPLAEPFPELIARGSVELSSYLRSLKDATPQYEAKLLVVGEGNVGKTTLVAALKGDPFVDGRPTTHGIEISPLTFRHPVLDLDMTLRAWDFGGQDVYRISHQFFYSSRALYLVVWHARQGEEQDEVEGWLHRIQLRVGRDARALLVATHCRERRPELDYPRLKQLFPGMLAGFFEVDSRTGDGIPALQEAIARQAAKLPQMGQLISDRWINARESILAKATTDPQIRYEQFTEICERHEVKDSEIDTLVKLMNDLGLIIYYADDEGLKDIVVLNPEWLTQAISYLLEDKPTSQAAGILDHARLKDIWRDRIDGYAARHHPYFLRLMEKFDISYRIDGDELHSLVAQLVPHQRPVLPWSPGTQPPAGVRRLALVCRMSEPAPGLIPWLTVRHHRASTGTHWRRGVFLRHPIAAYDSEALVELLRNTDLAVEVRAPSPDLFFNALRDSIEELITRRWPGLAYRLFVPCVGEASQGTPCGGQFPLDGLLRIREGGETTTVACMDCGHIYEISALLTGFSLPVQPLTIDMDQMYDQLSKIKTSVFEVQGKAAEIAEIVRRVQRVIGTEVADCPRLFTLTRSRQNRLRRARIHQDHYTLTLWCEHPGYWHPWEPASYELDPPKQWLVRIGPYAALVVRTLQLVVPLAGSIAAASAPQALQGNTQARLQVMSTLVADLPSKAVIGESEARLLGEGTVRLAPAEGEALRALRTIILEHDQYRIFGGMRRIQTPSGDLLWVCPDHYPVYDPGLPVIP